ncbi:amidohydrolase [Myxococcus landrumensis]|uniref:Amidohydrolase family protein n=1 Tax=Myxococcus landrumensis TaxID=2813577 RepID=A0ABX7N5I1_9BACT|nr:amidohydrolase family protein [Myxococcus landrumus]QSQ13878.1 amidohydrolase family protein [Myxococcus landrumus]
MNKSLCVVLSLAVLACNNEPPPEFPQTLYRNAKVFTARASAGFAESLLVEGGKVRAVGTALDVEALTRPEATIVDLGGRTLVPGLVDAHAHVAPLGHPEWWVNDLVFVPGPGPSAQEVARLVKARAATTLMGTPIMAYVSTAYFATVGDNPRALLDAATSSHPVLTADWMGHGATANSAMLALAGYVDGMPDPFGGRLSRDSSGRLTGHAQGLPRVALLQALSDRLSSEDYAGAYDWYADFALRYGYTATVDLPSVLSEKRAAQVHAAQVSLHQFIPVCLIDNEGELCAPGPDGVVRRKVFLDGNPVDCSTWVSLPYLTPRSCPDAGVPWLGQPGLTRAQLDAVLADVITRGGQLYVHAVGDSAVELLLSRLETWPPETWGGRVSVEHADLMNPGQVTRAGLLGIAVVQTPTHFPDFKTLFPLRFEPELTTHAQPLRSLLVAGIPLALGSDNFGLPSSPWTDVMRITQHPLRPDEALTREQAVTAWTKTAAQVRGLEGAGELAKGHPATFAVLSQDVFTVAPEELLFTRSVLTVVAGEVAWSDGSVLPATEAGP